MRGALMVQGTTSDAGKSVLVAGLCRVLARDGQSVAPFKPQNMSLNSAVTDDGGEIGRAQALQAEAAGIPASVDMNPVLLKPSSDTRAQVILRGQVFKAMDAMSYHDYKSIALATVLDAFTALRTRYDTVIVEGAGSPAEINLRDRDIANMGFAEPADCPVIIVADIDRGGVFAHLVGTLELLSATEQNRVKGFVINRFRGDIKLLESGLEWLQERTGKPVFGVLPFIENLRLDAEDAIDTDQTLTQGAFTVVVPVLKRISNHTDFDALRHQSGINLVYGAPGDPLPPADLIILPGSKNVRADMQWLREQGWDTQIMKHLRFGGKVLGICGGYQMLGQNIHDPDGIEDSPGTTEGLGLLPCSTELKGGKQLLQVAGTVLGDAKLRGYEIHCGETRIEGALEPIAQLADGRSDGAISEDGRVAGTYIHGLFDQPEACHALLKWAGCDTGAAVDVAALRNTELDRLASTLEHHLDLAALWRAAGIA